MADGILDKAAPRHRRQGDARVFDSRAVRLCCGLLVAFYVTFLWTAWFNGPFRQGDFSVFWAAGRLAAAGNAAAAYDPAAIAALQPFSATVQAFFYPPLFFLLLAPLGILPYAMAAALWVVGSLAGYVAAMRAILPGLTGMIAALAAPPVLIVLACGQNGLLLAALLAGALVLLDARPLLAGVLIGTMAFKPHYGILLPFFLALTGRWRVFAAAALTVIALSLAAALLFGWSAYVGFFGFLRAAAFAYAQQSGLPHGMNWPDMPSAYGMIRTIGFGAGVAAACHLAVASAAVAAALWLTRSKAPLDLGFAALAAAMQIITPYGETADWNILTVAMAFLVRDGLRHRMQLWEKAMLAAVFVLPLANLAATPALRFPGASQGWWFAGPIMAAVLLLISVWRALAVPRPRPAASACRRRRDGSVAGAGNCG